MSTLDFKLYVGNLDYGVTADELAQLFSQAGEVVEVALITDRYTHKPRGFAFVIMKDKAAGEKAIEMFNGKVAFDRRLVVNWARPKKEKPAF